MAAKVGFPGVDVDLKGAMKQGLEKTQSLLESLKLKPAFVNLPTEYKKDDATFNAQIGALADAGSFAAAIGCPRMMTYIMPSSPIPKAELRAIYKRRLTKCADILARSHVRLGLEFLGPLHLREMFKYEFIWRMNDMLAFAKEIGPNVGLVLDAWHWYHAGATVEDIIAAGKQRIVVVHFDDSAKLPPEQIRDNQRLMPGEGVIPLVPFLHALRKIGYEDGLSVDVFGRGLDKMTPEEGARLGLMKSREVLRKAGIAG